MPSFDDFFNYFRQFIKWGDMPIIWDTYYHDYQISTVVYVR